MSWFTIGLHLAAGLVVMIGLLMLAITPEIPVDAGVRLLVLLAYLVIGMLYTPEVDMQDLGWGWGILRVDNPTSWSDDWNRSKLEFAFLLAPAKIVGHAGKIIWALAGANATRG